MDRRLRHHGLPPSIDIGAVGPIRLVASHSDETNTVGTGYTMTGPAMNPGQFHFACVVNKVTVGSQGSLTCSQAGATWTLVQSVEVGTRRLSVFRCQPGVAVAAQTITFGQLDPATTDWAAIFIYEVSNVRDDSLNNGAGVAGVFSTGQGVGTAMSCGLPGFSDSRNARFAFGVVNAGGVTLTPSTPYTEINEASVSTSVFAGIWAAGVLSPGDPAMTSSASQPWEMIGVETAAP